MRAIHELKTNGGRKVATSRFSRSSALQCSCRTNDCSYLMISYFRGSFKIKLFAIVKDSRSFDVFDVFLTSASFFCQIAKFFIGQFAYHTRDKQIELPPRGRPILLLLVWLQIKLDSTQFYYHYLLCTQIIKSDLRSARDLNCSHTMKDKSESSESWFDSSSSEKVNVSPSNFLAAILFSQMFFLLSAWKTMTGKNREGQLLVYDCMANASLPWLNASSHRQRLA